MKKLKLFHQYQNMTNLQKPPFILVDGSSYLYRAFHAMPPLSNAQGQPTGAIYGVINMLRRLISTYHPEQMAVVFDAKGKNFRHSIYPDYKATRPPMPDELQKQIKPLHTLITAMGLPLIIIDDVEADDVIGTLAHQGQQIGLNVLISTGDKDMAQLVSEHITLVDTMNNVTYDRNAIITKFGVAPEQIIDYLSLMGDKVDNVPGVDKVGPKTAAKWLEQYQTLENLLLHAADIGGKVGENLRAAVTHLALAKQLVTIKTDVSLPYTLQDLFIQPAAKPELINLYKKLEFKTWLADAEKNNSADAPLAKEAVLKKYQIILEQTDLDHWLTQLQQVEYFSFDTETTSLDIIDAAIVGVSFSIIAGTAAYVPLAHDYPGAPTQLNRDAVLTALKPLLEDSKKIKIGQNLKYDASVLKNYDITLRGIGFDTMLESYILNSIGSRHDMDTLALKHLAYKTVTFEEVAGKGSKQLQFNDIDINTAGNYAAEDADITLQLHNNLWPQLQAYPSLVKVFTDIEMPLVPVLSRIERYGVLLDKKQLQQQSAELAERLSELQQEAYQLAGELFNLDSPKQLQHILFEKLKLPMLQKTPKGQASTAENVLQELALDYPLPKVLMEYRSLNKLKTTYTDRLPEQINPRTGRVHTSYHQAVTATGRLSSSDPNLQNIPIRNEAGRRIRKAFIAPPNYKIIAADYSQIELRIMAHLSQDPQLLLAFKNGWDIHKATAAEVFNVRLDEVTQEQRRSAKAINFGLIYGMSAFGLAKQLDIERQQAQAYMDLYFERYPGVYAYMQKTRDLAHQQGFVETLFGRRLYLPEINAKNIGLQRAAERTAINAPMQGTAADIIKYAMLAVDAWLNKADIPVHICMQVHDELVFEVHQDQVTDVIPIIQNLMSNAASLAVPLVVDVGVGNNWDEAH